MSTTTDERRNPTTHGSSISSTDLPPPLRPDFDGWDGLRAVGHSTAARILHLDADRLVPVSAFMAVCFCVVKQADWIPYTSIVIIALSAMLLRKGIGNDATTPFESTKDPPQPRNAAVSS